MDLPTIQGLSRTVPGSQGGSWDCRAGGANAVEVSGAYVAQLVSLFQERRNSYRTPRPSPSASFSGGCIQIDHALFDPIEAVVFQAIKGKHYEGFARSQDWFRYHQFMAMLAQITQFGLKESNDFFTLRVVGRGGFGLVNACKKATTGKLYALKQMSKRRIKLKHCEELILAERNIMARVHSPYLVNLIYAFASPDDVYLVLDFMIGGDLNFHLKTRGKFSLQETKYFLARTALGIAALHELGFVHRYVQGKLSSVGRLSVLCCACSNTSDSRLAFERTFLNVTSAHILCDCVET